MTTQANLEQTLSEIPYPGEDQELVSGYLRTADLAERVITETRSMRIQSRRHLMWTVFTVMILVVTVTLGLSPTFQKAVSGDSPAVAIMVYIILGSILTIGFVGWVMTMDPISLEQVLSGRGSREK